MFKFFATPNQDLSPNIQAIKGWVTEKWHLPKQAVISIMQVNCTEPNCPDMETLITIFDENQPNKQIRIRKPLVFIRKWDIAQATLLNQ